MVYDCISSHTICIDQEHTFDEMSMWDEREVLSSRAVMSTRKALYSTDVAFSNSRTAYPSAWYRRFGFNFMLALDACDRIWHDMTWHDARYGRSDILLQWTMTIKKTHVHTQTTGYRIKQPTNREENWEVLMTGNIAVCILGCDCM
jgi:hypothetical protein